MTKVQGTYASVVKGVSQQAPADRLEGQHGEMVNMIADPVRGLVRRNGFIMERQQVQPISADPENAVLDSFGYRLFSFRDQATDYDLLYRSRARVGSVTDAHLEPLLLRNKSDMGGDFLNVYRDPLDTDCAAWEDGGFSAVTSIGSYVLMAGNDVAPTYDLTEALDALTWKNSAVIWIRGGSYARTFTIKARRASNGATYSVSYTTPVSQYPGVLDLTQIPAEALAGPYEGYFTNFLQADYDTKVNQWTAMASAAIVPKAIAVELATRLQAAGWPGWAVFGSNLVNDDCEWLEVNDGGDGTYARAIVRDVQSASDVTEIARVGKVLRVQPSVGENGESYYLKAYAKVEGNTDPYQTVVWREAAGKVQRPLKVLAMGRIVAGTFYWGSTPAKLKATVLAATGTALDVPDFVSSNAGDEESAKPPHFFGFRITMLTVFQDRLGIGSGSVVNWSKVGDYFNWYRSTMLTIPEDDPVEMYAVGTEADTIRQAVTYDRNLMMLGDKFHYAISGKQLLSAASPNMAVQSAIAGTAYAAPQGIGDYVFVAKEDNQLAATRLLQLQAGAYQDSPKLTDASAPLRDYINGTPAELLALTSPAVVIVRTEHFMKSLGGFPRARPWGLYVYSYLDSAEGQRLSEAWGAWEWSTALGTPIGISSTPSGDGFYLYTLAFGADETGAAARGILCQKCSVRPDPTGLPYLDGMRPAADAEATGLLTAEAVTAVQDAVWTAPDAKYSWDLPSDYTDANRFDGLQHPHYTVGDAPPEGVDTDRWNGVNGLGSDYEAAYPAAEDDNLWTGTAFPAFFDPTPPFVRDRDGKANTDGRMVLIDYTLTCTRTAGLTASWIDMDGTKQVQDEGPAYDRINYDHKVFVGRDVKYVQPRIAAKTFLPLTVNAMAWKGNWFAYKGRA